MSGPSVTRPLTQVISSLDALAIDPHPGRLLPHPMSTPVDGGREESSAVRRLDRSFEQAQTERMDLDLSGLSPDARLNAELLRAAGAHHSATPGFGRTSLPSSSSTPAVAAAPPPSSFPVASSPSLPSSLAAAVVVAGGSSSSLAAAAASHSLRIAGGDASLGGDCTGGRGGEGGDALGPTSREDAGGDPSTADRGGRPGVNPQGSASARTRRWKISDSPFSPAAVPVS